MKRLLLVCLVLAACSTPPPPSPAPQPEAQARGEDKSIGTVRVTANTLNVRREAAASAEVIAQVRKGERLTLLSAGDAWDRVRLGNGAIGFVAVEHVIREGAQRTRRGCAPDAEFQFTKTPVPDLRESSVHGMVTVEANVDTRGNVTSTRIVGNTTGDDSLAGRAEREIREAKFSPPIRNCVAKAFIFTYKRSF